MATSLYARLWLCAATARRERSVPQSSACPEATRPCLKMSKSTARRREGGAVQPVRALPAEGSMKRKIEHTITVEECVAAAGSACTIVNCRRGKVVFSQGDDADSI